jgi:DNA-binding NtrC family response regulator
MPKVSGVELLKKIRGARMTLPVIMATGTMPMWEFALHTWLQPVKMLLKPYSFEKLLGTVKSVLHESSGTRSEIAPSPILHSQPAVNHISPSTILRPLPVIANRRRAHGKVERRLEAG